MQGAALGQPPAPLPSGDTITGQLGHLDELINMARSALDRACKIATVLSPPEPPSDKAGNGHIEADPNSGPILFRLQNRNQELHRLLTAIAMQQCRIEQVL